jgi:TonB-linked SusC/RagA family outer membrane protein
MKKSPLAGDELLSPAVKKLLLSMKLAILLVIISICQVSGHAISQKLTLNFKQTEIANILSSIEKEGTFRFLYNAGVADIHQKVDLDVTDATLMDVLQRLFSNTRLSFQLMDNNLVVIRDGSPGAPPPPVHGKVLSDSGTPLLGVSVVIKGTKKGTVTDAQGNFSIDAASGTVLVFSYVGYDDQETTVADPAQEIAITLKESKQELQQVVVVGYGVQKKIDVTGAVAHVSGDVLTKQPVLTATQALQGQIAGVQVTSSGQPGSMPQVIIRGAGSILAGANPLYIVDGIWTDDITNINTADITSLDVLKDASAASIYGVRGANGVILITTRQGTGKMKVNYSLNIGVQQAAYVVPMANAQQYLQYESAALGPTLFPTGYNTNWYNSVLRNAFYQTHNLSLTGGSSQYRYALSVGYETDDGIIIGNDYSRYTVRLNNEFTPATWLKIGTTASWAGQPSQNVPTSTITEDAYRAAPTVPAMVGGKFGNTSAYQNVGNPILDAQSTNDLSHNNRLQGNVYVEIKPIPSVTLKSAFGDELNFYDDRAYTYQHPNDTTFFNVSGGSQGATRSVLNISNSKYYHWVWTNTIGFDKDFGRSRLSLLAGTEAQKYYNVGFSAYRYSVPPIPSEWYLQDGDQNFQYNNSTVDEYTTNSYLGRIFYSFDGRYQFTGNFRADGGSVFSAQHRWGYFPGVSAGWVISSEKFMQNQKTFQHLKLRASWGELGNSNIPSDASIQTNISNIPYFFNSGNSGGTQGSVTGQIVPQVKDLGLNWEVVKEADFGLEYGILNNHLTGELDVYDKKATNALIYVRVPGTFGSQNNPSSTITPGDELINAATIDNKGLEFSARWHDNINRNLSYFVGGNLTYNKNTVTSLNGGLPFFDGNINGYFTTETKPGYPIGAFFMRQVIGVFQNQAQVDNYTDKNGNLLEPDAGPGSLIYKFNSNGTIDTTYQGAYQPKLYIGINGGVTWKSWDLSLDIYSNLGNRVYNGKEQARVTTTDNVEKAVATSYWTQSNKSETQPAANGGNQPASSYFISSGSFVRLNNLVIGYNMPSRMLDRQKVISSLRIFVNGQNLVTLKKYDGFSSELPGSQATNAGIEMGTYPTTRIFAFGINLGL